MDSAIQAAVLALLAVAFAIVVGVIIKSVYDSRNTFRVRSSGAHMKPVGVGPAPVLKERAGANSSTGETYKQGKDISRRRLMYLGGIVGAAIGTLVVKLWSMQIISSDAWAAASQANMTTSYSTPAARGRILDRNGVEIATNRLMLTVAANADVASDREVIHRLSNVLGIPRQVIKQRASDTTGGAQASRVIATDVDMKAISYISEHPTIFPGVSVETRTQRVYPFGTLAAHVIGYCGTISETQLATSTTPDGLSYQSDDIVGKSGAELSFEDVLQGVRGTRTVEVDASGNVLSVKGEVDAQPGNDISLTIDMNLQRELEGKFEHGIDIARQAGYPNADAGAGIIIDVTNGEVLAMASYPTFDPNEFVNGISSELWDSLNTKESRYPLTNRAISGAYPAASTFKTFGAMAGLKYGFIDTGTYYLCTGTWTALGEEWAKHCWVLTGHGDVNIYNAIAHSCDIYFYNVSLSFYRALDNLPDALQSVYRSWGYGSKTGIELAGEAKGRIPTPEWKAAFNSDTPEQAMWLPGDMANMIIGQGDVLVTPLQECAAYSGIANGVLHKPHILLNVLGSDGAPVISEESVEADTQPEYSPDDLATLHQSLELAVAVNADYDGFGVATAGKTGTGQIVGKDDIGWYIGYAPADDPKYCIAMCIEQAGSSDVVCPLVREMFSYIYDVPDTGAYNVIGNAQVFQGVAQPTSD